MSAEGTTLRTIILGVLSESLALFALGLIVAPTAMWCYRNLTAQVAAFNLDMENASVRLIDVLSRVLQADRMSSERIAPGSRQRGVSRRKRSQAAFAISGEGETRPDIGGVEVREVLQNLGFGHAGCQVVEDIVDRYPESADTGLAFHFVAFYRNDVTVVHCRLSPVRMIGPTRFRGSSCAG